MLRSSLTRAFGALVALAAVSLVTHIARAGEITQSDLPAVVFVAGTSTGSQAFVDLSGGSVDTGNVDTATIFTIGNLFSTSNTGYFAGFPASSLGTAVSFNSGVNTSLSFGTGAFGSFASTLISEESSGLGFRNFLVLGNYTAGTSLGTLVPNPAAASFRISFTQSPVGTGAISDSATLAIPPVPEPLTLMLACVGIAGGIAVDQNRRRNRRLRVAAQDSATNLG
jgi:hypothetical protein